METWVGLIPHMPHGREKMRSARSARYTSVPVWRASSKATLHLLHVVSCLVFSLLQDQQHLLFTCLRAGRRVRDPRSVYYARVRVKWAASRRWKVTRGRVPELKRWCNARLCHCSESDTRGSCDPWSSSLLSDCLGRTLQVSKGPEGRREGGQWERGYERRREKGRERERGMWGKEGEMGCERRREGW